MLRLLFIFVLSFPTPPQSTLSYIVTEELNGEKYSGFYNITIRIYSSYVLVSEHRDESENSTKINGSMILPGTLRYPIVFFDPSLLDNVTFHIYNRVLNDRNGSRELESLNIQTGSLYIFGGLHNLTTIYISASRTEGNKTESLESTFRLISDLGLTYYVSIEAIGSRNYKLHIKLYYEEKESGVKFSYKLGLIVALIGAAVLALLSLLLKLPIKIRSLKGFSRWLVT